MTTQMKTTVNQDLILAAREGLIPVRESTHLGGFGNMFRKELDQWWRTRTWWAQTITWVLILNGVTTIIALTESMAPEELLAEVVGTFLAMGMMAVGIGTVIKVQGAIISEKQLGTAAWVLSKPASRSAFILAKLLAYAIGHSITAILIPSTIFIITMQQLISVPFPLLLFLIGLGIVALGQFFYLSLTLMLGTFFNTRGPIAGIGITFIMIGLLMKNLMPLPILISTPWPLPDIATGLILGTELPSVWSVPILATIIWIVVMLAAALWRFEREEF